MSQEPPRIAILADWWWPDTVGGAELSARSAALELARFAQVAIFVPAAVQKVYADGPLTVHALRRPFARRVHAESVVRHGMEFLTAWLLPPVTWRLSAAIRDFDPDVTVATNVSRTGPWLLRRAKASRSGYVRTFHDLSDTCWRRSRLKAGHACASICGECQVKTRIMRAATPASAVSVCVSGFVQAELIRAGLTTPEESIVAYPMTGSDTTVRPPATTAGDLVLGYIGRLDPVKGIEPAIRTAAAYRRATGKAVSMVVAGEGQAGYVRQLAALADAESLDVDFAGRLDIDTFCGRVDAVLIPSTWMEPFGRVAVEVGSRYRPMLISPTGGLPEAAAVSGGRYAFADFQDPQGAAQVLADLLNGVAAPARPATTVLALEQGVVLAVQRALGMGAESGR
jgi:glycosyltransferase involved in cell wall biosynthesis